MFRIPFRKKTSFSLQKSTFLLKVVPIKVLELLKFAVCGLWIMIVDNP